MGVYSKGLIFIESVGLFMYPKAAGFRDGMTCRRFIDLKLLHIGQ